MDSNRRKIVKKILVLLLTILGIGGILFLFYDYVKVFICNDKVYPNTYLGDYKISEIAFVYLGEKIDLFSDNI